MIQKVGCDPVVRGAVVQFDATAQRADIEAAPVDAALFADDGGGVIHLIGEQCVYAEVAQVAVAVLHDFDPGHEVTDSVQRLFA